MFPDSFRVTRRINLSLASGALAIFVNTALLLAADQAGIVTARGGLLTLLSRSFHIPPSALARSWPFQQAFHLCVGLGMAVVYGVIVEAPRSRAIVKSLFYALVVWLANALVVLPLIGQGIAGTRILSANGIVYFAVAHTMFFVINGLLFAGFSRN